MTSRDCHNCAHVSCGRSHQFRETDCRFFKAKQGGTEKEARAVKRQIDTEPLQRNDTHREPDRSDWPHCSRTSCNRNDRRRCEILTDNDFGGRQCPFYRRRDE